MVIDRETFGRLCLARDALCERSEGAPSLPALAARLGFELALEPNANPAARTFQKAMFDQGIPLASFEVSELASEFRRLRERGGAFTREPTRSGPVLTAVFSDTCGNLIQLHQPA